MTNITINTKDTKKRGNGMKKILAILLAIITVFAMSIPAFAADETAKDVDNTFDNYTPAPGKTAPENWYDPYCYDEDGHINAYAIGASSTIYCPTVNKIFASSSVCRGDKVKNPYYDGSDPDKQYYYKTSYAPYETLCSVTGHVSMTEMSCYYCPYCGLAAYSNFDFDTVGTVEVAALTHCYTGSVTYCWYCDECGDLNGMDSGSVTVITDSPKTYHFTHSWEGYFLDVLGCQHEMDLNETKVYRFLTEEQRNAEYAFIYEETASQFGDGVDGRDEDLVREKNFGYIVGWNQEGADKNPSFGDKIVNFFKSIGSFFANIINWFQKIFGIVK